MPIASFQFLAFSGVAILFYNSAASRGWRQGVLFVANLLFLATFSQGLASFLPLVCFLAFGYIGITIVERSKRRLVFAAILVATILLFMWLKKYTFLPHESFLESVYVTIGLSYILFRVLHLVIDARDGNLPAKMGPVDYLNYTLNFTTLVSGPIQWYQDYAAMQMESRRPPLTIVLAGEAIERIVFGMFKVIVLATALEAAHKWALGNMFVEHDVLRRVLFSSLTFVTFPVYLYFNFSGYTDIVIGAARFLRLRLPENFDRPFSSLNFLVFWGRWHITLSTWLKTYVYNPLLKVLMKRFTSPRIEPFLAVFAFFVTFFIVGLWHGQTSLFIFFGVLLGLGVSVNKLYQILMVDWLGRGRYRELAANRTYQAFSRGFTFTYFTFSSLWFWSNWTQLASMVRAQGPGVLAAAWIAVFLGATLLLAAYEGLRSWVLSVRWLEGPVVASRYVRTVWDTALTVIIFSTIIVLNSPAPDIVYKGF
jgi:alginate O-acetyltransferase complex protein AlgI